MGGYGGGLQPVPQPLMVGMDPNTGSGGFTLPAALLAQYPALQNIDWSQVPSTQDDGDLSDVGIGGGSMGRASFDASSGGEYFDDGDVSEGYVSGSGMPQFSNQQGQGQMFLPSQ
jgi:transcription factor CRZ1